MTSSTKPEMHNLLQCHRRRTKQQSLQATFNIYVQSSTLHLGFLLTPFTYDCIMIRSDVSANTTF